MHTKSLNPIRPLLFWLTLAAVFLFTNACIDIDSPPVDLSVFVEPLDTGYVEIGGSRVLSNGVATSVKRDDVINLVARPRDERYSFDHWEGDASGPLPAFALRMDSDKMVRAVFRRVIVLATTPTPTHTPTPVPTPTDTPTPIPPVVTPTPVPTAMPTPTNTPTPVPAPTNTPTPVPTPTNTPTPIPTVTPTPVPTYSLNKASVPVNGGSVNLLPDAPDSRYAKDTVVAPIAVASANFVFDRWEGDCSGTINACVLTMDGNKNITAHFIETYALDISSVPTNVGSVIAAPSPNASDGRYKKGTLVTLTPIPTASGFVFDSWGGACEGKGNPCTITMDGDKSVTARFTLAEWQQPSVNAEPGSVASGGGMVVVSISTKEVATTVSSLSFTVTGPNGFSETKQGSICAVAEHPEATPPYVSRCWNATFSLPANTTAGAQSYTMAASSPQIASTRSGSVIVQAAPPPVVSGKIVFTSERDGNAEIYVMNPDGSGQTRLTFNSARDMFPALSPDGTRVVFASERDTGKQQLYVMNTDGSNVQRLTFATHPTEEDSQPSWCGNNTIVYGHLPSFGSQWDIWRINANGTGATSLITSGGHQTTPECSPGGDRFVFDNAGPDISVANIDGSNVQAIGSGGAPGGWSPDGSKLALSCNIGGFGQICVMNADGSGLANISNVSVHEASPSWSSDGTKIVLNSMRSGRWEIWVMNTDGSNAQQLTNVPGGNYSPHWR